MEKIILAILFLFLFSCSNSTGSSKDADDTDIADFTDIAETQDTAVNDEDAAAAGFIKRNGSKLVLGEKEVVLRGIGLGNLVWANVELPVNHHDETEYKKIKTMGMNTVRFYINYITLESDSEPFVYKQAGWDWLDENVKWAKNNGIYLILNIHVPQGGFQSMGGGGALWTVPQNQDRFAAMWAAIAARYSDEPQIAGYDILNEPVTTESIDQWKTLAAKTVKAIRAADKNHLLIIEPLNGIIGKTLDYTAERFFLVDDDNAMYDFHFYAPTDYTWQGILMLGIPEDGPYPYDKRAYAPHDAVSAAIPLNNPSPAPGDSDWTKYDGLPFKVTDTLIVTGYPLFFCKNNTGKVWFDDITITELDKNGASLSVLSSAAIADKYSWYSGSGDANAVMAADSTVGHGDSMSLSIANAATNTVAIWLNENMRFRTALNHSYAINGWMKGSAVSQGAACEMTMVFDKSPSEQKAFIRDKEYLRSELAFWSDFMKKNNVPIYIGEFSASKWCFMNDRGGTVYLKDVLDIMAELGVNAATFHQYYDGYFGLYEDRSKPETANNDLIDFFTGYFNH